MRERRDKKREIRGMFCKKKKKKQRKKEKDKSFVSVIKLEIYVF
jgi:hypothetical protein